MRHLKFSLLLLGMFSCQQRSDTSDISEEACGQWIINGRQTGGHAVNNDPRDMRFIADSIEEFGKRHAVLWIKGKRTEIFFDEAEIEKTKCQ